MVSLSYLYSVIPRILRVAFHQMSSKKTHPSSSGDTSLHTSSLERQPSRSSTARATIPASIRTPARQLNEGVAADSVIREPSTSVSLRDQSSHHEEWENVPLDGNDRGLEGNDTESVAEADLEKSNRPEHDISVELHPDHRQFVIVLTGDPDKVPLINARKRYLNELFPRGAFSTTFQRPIRRCLGGNDTYRNIWIDLCLYTLELIPKTIRVEFSPAFGERDILVYIWGMGYEALRETLLDTEHDHHLALQEQFFEIIVWNFSRFWNVRRRDPDELYDRCSDADLDCYRVWTGTAPKAPVDDILNNLKRFFDVSRYIEPTDPEPSEEDFRCRSERLRNIRQTYLDALGQHRQGIAQVDFAGSTAGASELLTRKFELEVEISQQLDWADSVEAKDPYPPSPPPPPPSHQATDDADALLVNPDGASVSVGTGRLALRPRTIGGCSGLWFKRKESREVFGSCGDQKRRFEDTEED